LNTQPMACICGTNVTRCATVDSILGKQRLLGVRTSLRRSLLFWTGIFAILSGVTAWWDSWRWRSSVEIPDDYEVSHWLGKVTVEKQGDRSPWEPVKTISFFRSPLPDRNNQWLRFHWSVLLGGNPGWLYTDEHENWTRRHSWRLEIPYWSIMLGGVSIWTGLLGWRSLRVRRKGKPPLPEL
jgi:hypothetical protein